MRYTEKEIAFINSLNSPVSNVDVDLVNSIINKMLINKDYLKLINTLNSLFDFATLTFNSLFSVLSKMLSSPAVL